MDMIPICTMQIMIHGIWPDTAHLLTQAGIFLAFTFPGFFRSTRRGSRVMQPAE